MNTIAQDLRFAGRSFSKNIGFTLAAVLSLAIGIGANTSIFSIINGLLIRPLPYKDADSLVILWNRSPGLNIMEDWFSTAQYFDIKTQHHGFEQVAIAIGGNENLTGNGEPERVGTVHVSSNLLPMLGTQAAYGRLFTSDEDVSGHSPTAVLSYGMWVRRYGSDPAIIGRSIMINSAPYEVVGITPKSFSLPREVLPTLDGAEQADILLPLPLGPDAARIRDHEDYNIIARLKRGVSTKQAQAEMNTITARLRNDYPQVYPRNGGLTFGVVPLLEQVVGDVRPVLYIMVVAVGFVLLIACANVANLLLSRAVARQQEVAIRSAMGASRIRLTRQLLTESILLAVLGGALGTAFAIASMHWVRVLGVSSVPRLHAIGVDLTTLLFTVVLSTGSGILFGMAPALRATRVDINSTLKDTSRGVAGGGSTWGRGNNLRRSLVIFEVALCAVLLIGAGLLIRSFARVQKVAPGFNPHNILTAELTMSGRKYSDPQTVLSSYRRIWERLEHSPGVSFAGSVTSLPLSQMFAWGPITVEGRIPAAGENFINADERIVSGHYFEAMQIPLLSGRFFDDFDTTGKPKVAIVDQNMAQQLWPGQDPIAKRIHLGGIDATSAPWITIVGVVGGVKQYTLDSDSRIAFYLPQTQYVTRAMNVVVKTSADPASLTSALTQHIHAIDPDLPIYNAKTMEQRVTTSLARRRFSMLLLLLFACFALGLAIIGIYGVMTYLVTQGTREIGIRIALGATPAGILSMVMRKGLLLAGAGLGIGLLSALALTRLMRGLLFGVGNTDPLTFAIITLVLATTATLAIYVAGYRAARVDPGISLRYE
jgi:predicted permease